MSDGFKEGVHESEASKADIVKSGTEGGTPLASTSTKPDQSASREEPVAGNFCIHCGNPNPSHALFCNACGKKIKDEN
jgi:membrane protease subunit (stomatin/prohibitin family)